MRRSMTNIDINKDNITEMTDGNYFADDTAVKFDRQNGRLSTVAFCIDKQTATDMAKGLNLYDNIMEELD
jgi:hypothetical protein